jgi:hypothetical protein
MIAVMRKQIEIAASTPIARPEPFRHPRLNIVALLPKKNIAELAALCNLPYKDGKVG